MKKVKSYSAEFKIVNFPNSRCSGKQSSFQNPQSKKKLTKQNQEFINNISASGFKQFNI
jgi:hypothetical protein